MFEDEHLLEGGRCGSASHCETLSVAIASLCHQITLSQPPIAFTCSISLFAVFPLRTSPTIMSLSGGSRVGHSSIIFPPTTTPRAMNVLNMQAGSSTLQSLKPDGLRCCPSDCPRRLLHLCRGSSSCSLILLPWSGTPYALVTRLRRKIFPKLMRKVFPKLMRKHLMVYGKRFTENMLSLPETSKG